MTRPTVLLQEYNESIRRQDQPAAVWTQAQAFFGRQGALHLVYAPCPDDPLKDIRTSLPDWWMDRYAAQNYASIDPVLARAATASAPIRFGPALDLERATLPPQHRQFLQESAETGLRCGISFPLFGASPCSPGLFTVATGLARRDFEAAVDPFEPALHLAALMTHQCLRGLRHRPAARARPLTGKEREALLLLFDGYRVDEIAHRLGVGNDAVNRRFARIKRRLGARTREQALSKAIVLGLIDP